VADRPIPDDLRVICAEMGGHELLGGNLRIYPLESDDPDALTVANASDRLRSWDWPVPDEMVVFGDNGQGDSFGLWVPRDDGARQVVVQIGGVFEEACLAVVAENLECFLRAWGTYYGLLLGEPAEVEQLIAELEIPEELRSLDDDGSDEEFHAVLAWACPGLPDPRPDPYARGLTAEQVDEFARSDGR
jgi:hypothetical protein